MTVPWTASQLLTGRDFQDRAPVVAFKQGRQSLSTYVALLDDADLRMVLPASATHLVEVNFGTTGNSAADITYGWSVTGGATVTRNTQAMTLTGTTSSETQIMTVRQSTSAFPSGIATTPAPCAVREKLVVTTGDSPTTLTLRWCQNSSSPNATSITDYGWATARRLI